MQDIIIDMYTTNIDWIDRVSAGLIVVSREELTAVPKTCNLGV